MLGEAFWNTVPYVTLAIVVVGLLPLIALSRQVSAARRP